MQAWKKSLVSLALALLTLSFLLWAHLLCPNAHNLKKVIEAWWYACTFWLDFFESFRKSSACN